MTASINYDRQRNLSDQLIVAGEPQTTSLNFGAHTIESGTITYQPLLIDQTIVKISLEYFGTRQSEGNEMKSEEISYFLVLEGRISQSYDNLSFEKVNGIVQSLLKDCSEN